MTNRWAGGLLLILLVLVVCSNRFRNDFQFDDCYAITDGEPVHDFLAAADIDRDIRLDVLADEIFYHADSNKDGIVTSEEWSAAIRSGMLGPVTEALERPRSSPH
jgi:hypothetical protein